VVTAVAGFVLLISTCLQVEAFETDPDSGIHTFELKNGMDALVVEDHRLPLVVQVVLYFVGAADEGVGETGIAHFLEHLTFRAVGRDIGVPLGELVSRYGGKLNATTSLDSTNYFEMVPVQYLENVMDIESRRMGQLNLLQKDFDTEKQVVIQERKMRVDGDIFGQVREYIQASAFINHPYRRPVIGWMHEIKALSLEEVRHFYGQYYSPSNSVLIVVGDVEPAAVEKMARKYYGKISSKNRGGSNEKTARPEEPEVSFSRHLKGKSSMVAQSALFRSYTIPTFLGAGAYKEAATIGILMQALCGGKSSLMYEMLVFQEGVADYVECDYTFEKDYGQLLFYVVKATDSSNDDIAEMMDKAINEAFTLKYLRQDIVDAAKNVVKAEFYRQKDDILGRALGYALFLKAGADVHELHKWPAYIDAVTLQDVQDSLKKYPREENSVSFFLETEDE
jgi:zinc protease